MFEDGPSEDIILQWATYRDASDQTSLSRIWGGIHPPADDIPGRLIGEQIGINAFHYAESYFFKDEDNDGYYNFEDCDDADAAINPGLAESCDGLDNDCNGLVDDAITVYSFYEDKDKDGFGNVAMRIDTCQATPLDGYVTNALDCNDNDKFTHPEAPEVCDGIDNNCSGEVDDGLTLYTYYQDMDGDGFGDAAAMIDTCLTLPAARLCW